MRGAAWEADERTKMVLGEQEWGLGRTHEMVSALGACFYRGSSSVFLSQARELGVSQMLSFLRREYNPIFKTPWWVAAKWEKLSSSLCFSNRVSL